MKCYHIWRPRWNKGKMYQPRQCHNCQFALKLRNSGHVVRSPLKAGGWPRRSKLTNLVYACFDHFCIYGLLVTTYSFRKSAWRLLKSVELPATFIHRAMTAGSSLAPASVLPRSSAAVSVKPDINDNRVDILIFN